MQVQSISQHYTNKITFSGHGIKRMSIKMPLDCFVKNNNGLKKISNIRKNVFGNTTCDGSLPLRNFWNNFKKPQIISLKKTGFSTNKDGYAKSFLKTSDVRPISTSFVHDCTVMYLHNNKTNTHMLYHAEAGAREDILNFVIDTLMPEGFTSGAIIPGCSEWIDSHIGNMNNMFRILKEKNPKAKVDVYHGTSLVPEIVGYKGIMYEIPNFEVQRQRKITSGEFRDYGQASFKIMDIQNYDTISKILYFCDSVEDGKALKSEFRKLGLPKEVEKCLISAVNKKIRNIKTIMHTHTLEDLGLIEKQIPKFAQYQEVIDNKREELLLEKFKKVSTKNEFENLYEEAQCYDNFSIMRKLHLFISELEEKFLA